LAAVFAAGLAVVFRTAFTAVFATGLTAGFLVTDFFATAGLDALALGIDFAAAFELDLVGAAFETGLAVFFAAEFLAEDLDGMVSFEAEERDMWRQFTH
jgi:hypothetical protein